jgi:hypothetical protein
MERPSPERLAVARPIIESALKKNFNRTTKKGARSSVPFLINTINKFLHRWITGPGLVGRADNGKQTLKHTGAVGAVVKVLFNRVHYPAGGRAV